MIFTGVKFHIYFHRINFFEDGYIQVAMPTGVTFSWGKNFTDRVKSMNMLPHINYPLYGSIGGGGGGGVVQSRDQGLS